VVTARRRRRRSDNDDKKEEEEEEEEEEKQNTFVFLFFKFCFSRLSFVNEIHALSQNFHCNVITK